MAQKVRMTRGKISSAGGFAPLPNLPPGGVRGQSPRSERVVLAWADGQSPCPSNN